MSMKNQNISFNHPSNYQRDLKIKSLFLCLNTIKDLKWNIYSYLFEKYISTFKNLLLFLDSHKFQRL